MQRKLRILAHCFPRPFYVKAHGNESWQFGGGDSSEGGLPISALGDILGRVAKTLWWGKIVCSMLWKHPKQAPDFPPRSTLFMLASLRQWSAFTNHGFKDVDLFLNGFPRFPFVSLRPNDKSAGPSVEGPPGCEESPRSCI